MDTNSFLDRIVAPGNYIAVVHSKSGGGVTQKFFARSDLAGAIGYMQWCASSNLNCWFGVASYRLAEPEQHHPGRFVGSRRADNAQALRVLFYDADISRPGDNKEPGKAFADWPELVRWLEDFMQATGMPRPSIWVNSGWGAHLYWVLEDALSPDEWLVQAHAFKGALLAHNAKGDVSISTDAARILRPPGTYNFKDPGNIRPVHVIDALVGADYGNAQIAQVLARWVTAVPRRARASGGAAGQTVAIPGTPPAIAPSHESDATDNAELEPPPREYSFAKLALACEQAKKSMVAGGLGDRYDLWYKGWVNLAIFCTDGLETLHEISKGDPTYNLLHPTEWYYDKAKEERDDKKFNPPMCVTMDTLRPGVCPTCPHWQKVHTPADLGSPDSDLPKGYRRKDGRIEHAIRRKRAKKHGGDFWDWETVVGGDLRDPLLDQVGEDSKLTFSHTRGGRTSAIAILQSAMTTDTTAMIKYFGVRGISGIYGGNAQLLGQFLVSWIEKLRDAHAERTEPVPPFGWVWNHAGDPIGLSVGGLCYRPNGNIEPAPGGDPTALQYYKPRGTLEGWKRAASFTLKGRPDLQILVAAAFASPLVSFTGHNGFLLSAWSRDSAVGKSSALTVGTTVWAEPGAMYHLKDTLNSVIYRVGHTKILPAYWDEIRLDREQEDGFIDTLFMLGQGKEKARLNSDATLKQSGDWKTILVATGNRPLMDHIVRKNADTDAGAVRLFEFLITHPQMPLSPQAQDIIAAAGKHAGRAGEVYARCLAGQWQMARDQVMSVQNKLTRELAATTPERFFIAGMSCILVGAAIARLLDLAPFDVSDMRQYLSRAFEALRVERNRNLPVAGGLFDIEKLLAEFISDHLPERLITDKFAGIGAGQAPPAIKNMPSRYAGGKLAIHIAVDDKCMRIDKTAWRAWAYKKGFSPSDTVTEMERRWNARSTRTVLGLGTHFASGRVEVIEMSIDPKKNSELAVYVYHYASLAP